MKKRLLLPVLILIPLFLCLPVRAAEIDTSLMEESLEDGTVFGSVGDVLEAVLENRLALDGRSVWDSLLSLFFLAFRKSLPSLTGLFVTGVLLTLAEKLGLLRGRAEEAAMLGGKLAFAALLLTSCTSFVSGAASAVSTASRFASAAMPTLVTLLVSSGAVAAASLTSPALTMLASVLLNVIVNILFPMLLASLLLTVLDSVLPESRLGGLADFFKSASSWLLGGAFTVFAGILSVQGLTGGIKDGATLRSVKYAISTSVPVIGGSVSESLSAVMAGAMTMKGAVGVTGIVVIAGILLQPVLNLAAFLLALRLLGACMAPFAGGAILNPIRGACACLRLAAAALLGVGILWFLFLGILIAAGGTI